MDSDEKSYLKTRRYIMFKYLIIIFITLTPMAWHTYQMSNLMPEQIFFLFYSIAMILIRTFQFAVVIDLIKIRLEMINEKICKTIRNCELRPSKYEITQCLLQVRTAYEIVHDVTMIINQNRGLSILSISTAYSILLIGFSYCRLSQFFKNVQIITHERKKFSKFLL